MSVYAFTSYSETMQVRLFDRIVIDKYRFQLWLDGRVVFSGYNEFGVELGFDPDLVSPNQIEMSERIEALEKELDAARSAVRAAKKGHAPRDGLPWSSDEEHELVTLYQTGASLSEIAAELDRMPTAVTARLGRILDLRRSAEAFDSHGFPRFPDLDVPSSYHRS